MKRRVFKTPKKNKKLKLAKNPTSFRLYEETIKDVTKMSQAEGITESEVLREIIRDWFRIKRIEVLGRDQVEDPVRAIYERVMSQQLEPLHESISTIKSLLQRTATGHQTEPFLPQLSITEAPSEIMEALAGIRSLLVQMMADVTASTDQQLKRLSEFFQSQRALHAITSETFASTWTISDFIVRYLVEKTLLTQGKCRDDVEAEVDVERRGLRAEGLEKILELEEAL